MATVPLTEQQVAEDWLVLNVEKVGLKHYRSASIVSSDRVVFNIKGNDYRMVAAIDYRRQIVFIKHLRSTL